MSYLKMLGLAAVAATALMAVTAGSASATTLEVGGVAQTKALTITAFTEASLTLSDTEGAQADTCSVSHFHASISVSSGMKVIMKISELTLVTCTRSPIIVKEPGSLFVEHEASSTSGSVFSAGTEVTVPTTFGFSVTCTTPSTGTKIGTLTGSASGNATLSIAAVLSCGFLLPSASWKGSYSIASPTKLGVVA